MPFRAPGLVALVRMAPLLLAVGACARETAEPLFPVVGTVLLGERPLATGVVSLRPDSGRGNSSLHHPTGSIDKAGNYELFTAGRRGAPAGWYKVVVFASEDQKSAAGVHPALPISLISTRYHHEATTPLALEVLPQERELRHDLRLEP